MPSPCDHATGVFRTRDGTAGLIHVPGTTDSPPVVRFKYKLLKSATTRPG